MKTKIIFLFLFCAISVSAQTKKWTLKECIAYALENNISIQQSALDTKITEISKKDALGDFLPNLSANVRHSWNTGLNTNPVTNTNVTATTQNTNFGVSANILLYNGMQNIHRLHKTNLEIVANQYQLENMKDNISLLVCNSFLQILFNKESLKNLEGQYQLSKESLERTQELVSSGSKPKGDLLDVEATLANQEQQIVQMKNNLLVSKLTLANVLVLEDALSFDIVDNFSQIPIDAKTPNSPQQIFSKALKFRNEIKISEVAIEMREKDVKIAKGNYLPTLSGSFGFNTNYFNSELLNLPGFSTQIDNNKGHSFGLNLSIPIFNRFKTSNAVKRSKIILQKAKLDLKNSKADLKDKIYQAYADKEGAFKTYMAALKTAKARKEAYTYAKEKHEVGLLNSFDLSQMQTNLENAETEVIRAKYDCIFKIKILEFYFGIPIDKI